MAVQIPFATISKINQTKVVEDIFLTGLLEQCQINDNEPEWLQNVRQQAKSWLSHLSVPTRKDEDWRFIDLADLTAGKFVSSSNNVGLESKLPLRETANSRLVFINGKYNAEQSDCTALPEGIFVGNLADISPEYDASKYFAQCHGAQDAFTSLNTASSEDITVVWAGKNTVVENPIQIQFIT